MTFQVEDISVFYRGAERNFSNTFTGQKCDDGHK